MIGHNPTFKPPTAAQEPTRSPSPPRKFVEPLSPAKPRPVEPVFNYPALNNHINYAVRPDPPAFLTQQARKKSVSYGSEKRTYNATPRARNRSSTIEQLAEAALATSPRHHVHSSGGPSALSHAPPAHSEPPHKRSRSELLPSPLITQYASRPATSYENSAWHTLPVQQAQHGQMVYDRRVEEAALLLNFRTGGWTTPKLSPPTFPGFLVAPNAPRPHANSFPQDAHQPRPVDIAAQAALLPPFNPQDSSQPRPTLPSPRQTIVESHSSPSDKSRESENTDTNAVQSGQSTLNSEIKVKDTPQQPQTQTPSDEDISRAQSTELAPSESSETATTKAKRGTPKGKARASGGRKSIAEKATLRRAAARKKTPGASKARKDAQILVADDLADMYELQRNRRKSLDDLAVTESDPVAIHRAQSVPRDMAMIIRAVFPVKAASRRKAKDHPEIICAGCATAREAKHLNGELDEWISCNGCKNWFHVDCAGFKKAIEVRDVDKYFCASCEPVHGKTTYVRKSARAHASVDYAELQRGVLKTSEEDNEHHYIQPIKDGTFQFDQESFPRMRPELVTRDVFERSGTFTEPICIPATWNPRPWLECPASVEEQEGVDVTYGESANFIGLKPDDYEYDTVPDVGQDRLGMVMPKELTVRQVCNLVGPDTPLDVIDVKTQNSGSKWTLSRWADYYEEDGDDKPIRNVISLEVSQTKLGRLLRRPKIVRDIDLQDDVWPQKEIDLGKWPKVQFYCLMSVADSYTDFHIDFGGSSVYYHILKGKKTFFFIPPKAKHLKAYEEWNDSPQQNYTFLPSITKECYRVDLNEGDTMLIPSGWIHAVWTPETSLVIGGNFLTRMSFQNQFKVVDIEKANETPMKFRYPYFQKIMWYTAIKYLREDPLPDAVSQLFHNGQRFERQQPIWADFDGDLAANDPRPGANNTRYYSQAELDGLPDLVTFIFHTVMLVMGRVEGISADRMKRVNASIPKGHGEPLELAKTFALWVAWKRNEDPPAWAHPDAVLPNSKEGPPKKLSARALKDLERKEAIAAWRLVPDRQSARVRSNATATASGSAHGPTAILSTSTPDRENTHHQDLSSHHHQAPPQLQSGQTYARPTMPAQATPVASPVNVMVGGTPYLSSPKTSVLGPKRIACDACRKRRIRCKHKDMVLQTSPHSTNTMQYMSPDAQYSGLEMHDNIVVKSGTDGHEHGNAPNGVQGQPLPGTNAYVNAHIPMAVNGVAIFDPTKRGRTKACYECRKSKRRCVHDENGNVDPVKASETPVARGSGASKKRPLMADEATPIQSKKAKSVDATGDHSPVPMFHQQQASSVLHAHQLHASPREAPYQRQNGEAQMASPNGHTYPLHHRIEQHAGHAPLDPGLFAYPATSEGGSYGSNSYTYSVSERPHLYQMQSLEQIASEVLDMNAHYQDQQEVQSDSKDSSNATTTHGLPMGSPGAGGSVDSGVSLPESEHNGKFPPEEEPTDMTNEQSAALIAYTATNEDDANTIPRPSDEASLETANTTIRRASGEPRSNTTSTLPSHRPPAPLSQSSDQFKCLPNGNVSQTTPEINSHKRKRNPMPSQDNDSKPAIMMGFDIEAEDAQKDLGQALQQQDCLGVQSG